MRHFGLKMGLFICVMGLTACSQMMGTQAETNAAAPQGPAVGLDKQGVIAKSVDNTGQETNVNLTMSGGGEIGLASMDASDKLKMSRALDGATGKATHWVNSASGVNFTVTPIKKVVIENNPFCRQYLVEVARGSNQKELTGTACVTTDGSWHTI
jgi:surface antigen